MSKESWFFLSPESSKYWSENRKLIQQENLPLLKALQWGEKHLSSYRFLELGKDRFLCRYEFEQQHFEIYSHPLIQETMPEYWKRIQTLYQRGTEMLIIAGGGLGYLASHIEKEIRGNLRKGMLFVENRPELVLAMFCLFDCKELIKSNQILWAVGDAVEFTFDTIIKEEALFLLDPRKVSIAPERHLDESEKKRFASLGKQFSTIRSVVGSTFLDKQKHFNGRMQQAPNMEPGGIWAVATPLAYAHTPLIRALVSGFREKGWEGHLLELNDHFSTRFRVQNHLISTCPDLILTVNNASNTFLSPQLNRPRISWILDEPRYFQDDKFRERLSEKDFVFYCDRTYEKYFQSTQAGACSFLPSTSILKHRGTFRSELAAPILFVGNFHGVLPHIERIHYKRREWIIELMECLIREPQVSSLDIAKKLDLPDQILHDLYSRAHAFAKRLNRPLSWDMQLDYFLYAVANSYKRYKYVYALLDRGIVIYGPETWQTVVGNRYAKQYKGWLPPEHLADVYASAEICLNVHSLQCPTSLNPRDFDVLAAGGCLLTDEVEDFTRMGWERGREAETFVDEEELVERVDGLLADNEKRNAMREQGHETYRQAHTPAHRVERIKHIVKEKFCT